MLTEWLEIFGLQTPSKPWAEEQKHADASSVGMLTGWYENLRAKLSSNEDPRVELEPQWFEVFGYKSSEGESLPLKPTKEDYFALDDYFTFWSSTFGIIVLITLFLACWQVLRVKKKYKNKQDEEVSSATQETCRRQRRKRPESRCLHYSAPSHDCAKYLERDNHLPLGCVESSELSKREPPGKNAEELYDHYHFWCDDLKTTAKEKLVKVLPFNHTDSCNHNDCVLCQDASSISEIPVADIVPELKPSLSPNVKLSSPSSRFAENENFSISSERTLSAVGITDNTSYAVGTQVVELYPCYVAPHLTQEVTHNSPLYASTSYSCNEGTSEMLHSSSLSELSSSFSKKERLYSSVASSQASSQSMSCLFCDDSSSDLSDYSDIVPTKSQSVLYVSPESANFSMTTETTKKQYNLSKKKKFTTSYTLSNSYHLMHCSDHSAKQKPGVNVYSRVSPITYLSKEQLHKIEVLQLKKILHLIFGIPPVVLESQTEAKMLAEARKKQEQGIQMEIEILTSDVLVLSPGQVQGLEHNVAKKALEITWGIPDIIRQSIELFKPPPPLLHKKKVKPVEITIEEVDSPVLTKNQIHSLEFNIKRKNVQQQWGLPTVIQKSLIMFIPLAPPIPLPRLILPGLGHKIVTTQLSWLDWDITSAISYNLKQKKLQHQWGLPKRVQESLDMLMPPHPFIMKKVVKKPFRDIIIVRPEIPESLLGTKLLQKLERNVKLKIIYKRWGLPLVIKDSFFNFIPPAPPVNYFIKCEKEKKLQKFNRMLQTQLLKPHAKEVQHIDKTTSCMPLMFLQKQKYKYLAFGHQASQQQKTNTETNTIMEYEKPNSLRQLLASGQDSKKALSGSWEETLIFLSPSTRDNDIKAVLSKETIMTVIKNLETYIIQKTFDVKLTIPHMIQKSINSTHKEGKKPSRNSIQYDCSYTALTVLEQDNIDKLDLHLKRKIIEQHWGLPPFVLQSLEQYIPKTSAHPVLTSRREDIIEHTEMPTPFISLQARKHLEFHIKKKMLQQQWGLPVAIQKSLDTFMPPAPGIPCKKDVHQYTIITKVSDLHFLSRESKEYLENNIKRKIINWWWGLPELIQASIDDFILKPPPIEKCDLEYEIKRKTISKISSIFMKDLGKKHFQSSLKQYFLNRVSVPGYIRSVKTCIVPSVIKECLDFHLVRKNHEIRIKQFPKRVRNSYKTGCPPAQKKSLPKLITNGNGFRKLRPEWIFFMEQDAVSRIKMNLMHKHLQNLFGLSTLHTMSLEMMIPKPSPLQLTLKARRAIIEFTAMEIPFISDKVRDHLEWHTKQKSLQSNWGLPFLVLKSVEAFIPPAPKLTIPMLRTVSQGDVIVLISKLEFINENTVEELETNVMKKINNIQLGHPKLIENSLRQFIPPPPPLQGGFLSTSEVYDTKLYQPLTPHFKLILRRKQTIKFADQTQLQSNYEKINIPLAKNSVETQSNMILKLVKTSYNSPYPSLLKKTLPNLVASDKGFRKSQTDSVLLTEQVALDHIDVNMKHKNLNYLFGLPTLSTEMMIPKTPPPIKRSGAMMEFEDMDIPFISSEVREKLELHIEQKKLQHNWGLPSTEQNTLQTCVSPTPKLIPVQLNPMATFDVLPTCNDLPFISENTREMLEMHLESKKSHKRLGLPILIQNSLNQFIPSAYVLSKNDSGNGKEKIGPIELPPNPLPYKYMTWRNSLSRQSSKTKVIRMSTVDEGTVAKPNLNPIVEGPNFVKDKEKPNFMEHNKANGDTTLASNVVPSLKLIEKLQNGTKTAATAAKVPAYKIANYCQDWVKDTIPITQPPLSQMTQIPNDLQTAMVSYCFQYITPRPDANDIQQIRETLELYFDKKKRMTDLLYLPPLVVSSIKLSKPPPAPFLPITLSQRSTVCNAVVPNFIIPQTLYDLTVVLDIHIRKKLLEVDLGIPALVEDSINLAKPSPAPKLGAKIRRIYLEEDFDVREMYNCMSTDMIQYNRTLSGIEDASHFGFLPPVETMIPSKEVIMEELEFHFKKKIISESLNFPYPGNTILAPELPSFLKHNHCTCLDYPYSPAFLSRRHAVQSQLIPYLMPKISDLITAKGSSTLGSQHNFDFQQQLAAHVMKKHTELNTSNVPPCVIASRRTYGESLLISQRTPRYSYPPLSIHRQSFGPSIIRTSIFLLDTALKKNINMHLKQKLIMSTAFLPQCVIESQTIYNAMITQRIRKAVRHLRMRLSAELQRMQDLDKKLKCDKEVLQTIWNTDELNSTALSSLSTFDCSPQNTKPFFSCKRREFALNEDKLQDIRQEHFKEKYCNSRSPNMECRYGRAIHCKTLFQALKPHRFITQSKAKILTKNQRNEHNTAVRHDFHKTRSTVGYCKPGALRNIHTSENDEFSDHSSQFTTEYESETFTEADEEATVMHCSKAHHSTVSQKLIGIEPPKMPALGRSCQSSKSVTFSDTIDIQQIRNETSMDEDALFLVSAKTSSLQANNRNETQSTTRDKVARKSAMSTSVQKTTHSERERQKKMELTQKEVSVSVNEDDQWKHFYKNNVKEDAHKKAVSPGTMYKYIENKIDVSQQSAALFSATMETENFLPNIGDAKEKLINVNSSAVNDSFFREQSNSMHNNWNENKLSGNAASRKGSTVQQSAIVIAEKGSVESSTATVNEKAMTRQYSATMGERGSVRWSSVSTDESTSTEQYPDTLDETGSAEEFIPTTNGKVTTRETPITTTSASTTNEESFAEEYISTSSGIQSSYTSREESLTDKTTSRKPPGARNVRRDQSIKRQLLSRSQKTSRKCDSVRYCPSVNRSRSMSMHRRQKSDETDSEVSQYSNPPSKVRSNEICSPRNRAHYHITGEVVSEAKFHFIDQATHCPRAVMNLQKRKSCANITDEVSSAEKSTGTSSEIQSSYTSSEESFTQQSKAIADITNTEKLFTNNIGRKEFMKQAPTDSKSVISDSKNKTYVPNRKKEYLVLSMLSTDTTSGKPPGAKNVRKHQSIKRQLLSRSQRASRKCDSVRYCPSANRSRSMSRHRRQTSDETGSEVSQYSNSPSKVRSNEICRARNRAYHHVTGEGVVSEAKFHFIDQATHCPRAVMNLQKRKSCANITDEVSSAEKSTGTSSEIQSSYTSSEESFTQQSKSIANITNTEKLFSNNISRKDFMKHAASTTDLKSVILDNKNKTYLPNRKKEYLVSSMLSTDKTTSRKPPGVSPDGNLALEELLISEAQSAEGEASHVVDIC
ncbi:uncharacterized protein LOC106703202 [Latimeria chalumnae]|uniref:uncharacterized protein LOC106703202 n=1 Tax=Latimeria chalumnae TaxID=7897 RepID=UPI00313D0E6C